MSGLCKCVTDCITETPKFLSEDNCNAIISNVKECHTSATQTIELCTSTLVTSKQLVSCGETIQQSLIGTTRDLDANSFAVIADLIDGDKTKEAKDLAVTMKDKSTECISLSIQMVDSLEKSVDALPDVIEKYIEKKAQQSVTNDLSIEERDMINSGGIDKDVGELERCVDAIENLNLLTAIESGKNAFTAIKEKSTLCHTIFNLIKKFASDVDVIASAVSNMDASTVLEKVKDGSILKAIGLSKVIEQLAEGCKRLMDKVIQLFHMAAGKLSTLWRALSNAKDVMVKSLTEVVNAKSLCGEANEKAEKLKQMTISLGSVEAINLVKSLGGRRGRSISDAADISRGIDDGIEAACSQLKSASKSVGDEYANLPSIITEGISDTEEDDEINSFSAQIRDVSGDIKQLEEATKAIEDADILHAATTIHKEVKTIPDKVDTCREMIQSCTDFTERSKSSIDTFLGKWSLKTAISHIKEMSRLVSLSKLMETLVERIHKLMKAITTLLQVISTKIQTMMQNSGLDSVVDSVTDAAADLVSDGISNVMGKVFGS